MDRKRLFLLEDGRLRTKIEDDPGKPKCVITVRGMGYKWNRTD